MLDITALDGALNVRQQDREDIVERLRFDDALEIPIELTDEDMWSNYVNEDLYAMDKALRTYLRKMRYVQERNKGFRTAVPLVFPYIFGRKATPKDSAACRMLHMLLRYYCTDYTGKSTIGGKEFKVVYKFNRYAAKNKRPYSLRLRIEEANDRGEGKPFVPYGTKRKKGPESRRNREPGREDSGDVGDDACRVRADSGGRPSRDQMAEA